MANHTEYEPFAGIIQRALAKRGKEQDDLELHPEYRVPKYVVRMCESLVQAIQEVRDQAVSLEAIIRLESTCTGTDYHHKLAMRCQRLTLASTA